MSLRPSPSPLYDGGLIPLAEQFANHDEYRPAASAALAGRALTLVAADGARYDVAFADVARLRWAAAPVGPLGREGEDAYEAVALRPGLWAITVARLAEDVSALVILDEPAGRAFANVTSFERAGDEVVERTTFHQLGIDGPPREPVRRTEELIGKRVAHRYSSTHVFEHIYVNPNTYAFQGLAGPEAGVADMDRADYFKLGDQLYLVSWHERMQPFNGAVVLDLAAGRATGRLVGWDAVSGATLQVRTGSRATVLSETTYEDL